MDFLNTLARKLHKQLSTINSIQGWANWVAKQGRPPAKPGEKRQRKDGTYEKQQDGSWVKVVDTEAGGTEEGEKVEDLPGEADFEEWART